MLYLLLDVGELPWECDAVQLIPSTTFPATLLPSFVFAGAKSAATSGASRIWQQPGGWSDAGRRPTSTWKSFRPAVGHEGGRRGAQLWSPTDVGSTRAGAPDARVVVAASPTAVSADLDAPPPAGDLEPGLGDLRSSALNHAALPWRLSDVALRSGLRLKDGWGPWPVLTTGMSPVDCVVVAGSICTSSDMIRHAQTWTG